MTTTIMPPLRRRLRTPDTRPATAPGTFAETRAAMFVATKRGADRLAGHLTATGLLAAAIHGGKSQGQRTRALEQFRSGAVQVLVATNVAARGVHIDDLDLAVNVDPPGDGKDYLDRGGTRRPPGGITDRITSVLRYPSRI